MFTPVAEIVRILRWELGARNGARYAEQIAAQGGQDAAAYAEAAKILTVEADTCQY
jgi:hypothetical protein